MKSVLAYPYIFNSVLNYGEIMENRLLTSSEVAEWLNMDEATVQRMSRTGELPAVKIGGRYRFRQADLEEWFNKQMRKGNGDGGGNVI
jgi:excisionase family DNA binding protein